MISPRHPRRRGFTASPSIPPSHPFSFPASMSSAASEFIFDPVKWLRHQVGEHFQAIAQTYGAMNSVVRVPLTLIK
ncbi:hypothetical protein F2Q68_00035959 [Brassica cretica]|uniref:Uncharacterized protein n=1 Tax=Brassica cretica TaxID=69181 RepID=A0A8S9GW17_BRACR|nr:hypothetical protein F2Q68_00035959 [Brassica cretica]